VSSIFFAKAMRGFGHKERIFYCRHSRSNRRVTSWKKLSQLPSDAKVRITPQYFHHLNIKSKLRFFKDT